MVMILADGSSLAIDVKKQLDIYNERYIMFYTDIKAAGSSGSGNVIIGAENVASIIEAIRDIRATAVIDATVEPQANISVAGQTACRTAKIPYVKYIKIEEKPGLQLCLSYAKIGELIKYCGGNALFYAASWTVSAIVDATEGAYKDKMYVPVLKNAVFDTASALEYSVPLLNVVEAELIDGEEAVASMMKKTGAKIIICDTTVTPDDKAAAAFMAGVPIVITHSMGMEYIKAVPTARDAVIAIHTGR